MLARAPPAPASPAGFDKTHRSATTTDTDTSSSERSVDTPFGGLPLPSPIRLSRVSPADDGDLGASRVSSTATYAAAEDDAGLGRSPTSPAHVLSVLSLHDDESSSQWSTREILERMRTGVIDAATHSTDAVRREATKAHGDPRPQLRNVRRLALPQTPRGVGLFQCKKARSGTTRVMGLTQLHAPIHEIVAVLSHRSVLSFPLLNPGVKHYETLHTLVDKPTQYVAVKSMVMHDTWTAPLTSRVRSFVVMESQLAFQTDDGRRGWVVTYHSLAWPGCPEAPIGGVRASVYNTGVVALERTRKAELIDMYSVAEFKLKGEARERADWTAAKDRVLDTLALLTGTIEQRGVSELELLETSAFHAIERRSRLGDCSLCGHSQHDRTAAPRPMFRCRKCCVSVCGACSSTWRRGTKALRLCQDCSGDMALEF